MFSFACIFKAELQVKVKVHACTYPTSGLHYVGNVHIVGVKNIRNINKQIKLSRGAVGKPNIGQMNTGVLPDLRGGEILKLSCPGHKMVAEV